MKKLYMALFIAVMVVTLIACDEKMASNEVVGNEAAVSETVQSEVVENEVVLEEVESTVEAVVEVEEETLEEERVVETEEADNAGELVDGMRPEFKEAMDSYEAFYEEYCEVLKKYKEEPTNLAILTEYSGLMEKSIEMSVKFEEWDEGELNTDELKYYVEVSGRVTQMLVEVGGE